jgi:hypothetical protein
MAAEWWNYPYDKKRADPKDENELSDHIAIHLQRDLEGQGLIVNREVTMRRGNANDILVDAVSRSGTNQHDRITLVCEVKGCWNEELMTSMKTQLHERYLLQSGIRRGIYIVVYCDGPRWVASTRNKRHRAPISHTLAEIRDQLDKQAHDLSTDGFHISAVVLDANFESGRPAQQFSPLGRVAGGPSENKRG